VVRFHLRPACGASRLFEEQAFTKVRYAEIAAERSIKNETDMRELFDPRYSSELGGGRGPRRSHGAKPRQLEWHLGDKVRVRAERIDPLRKRVEFALVEGN